MTPPTSKRSVGLRRLFGLFIVLAPLVVAASLSPACRTPTQVTVELRTIGGLTCAQVKGVGIVVARNAEEAEAKMAFDTLSAQVPREQCGADPRLLGTLVITPSDGTGAIIVRARISDAPDATCKPPTYKGCIVSRRAFAFIDNAAVTLPISLEQSCLDVPCDVVSSCRTGKCVSSNAVCSESTNRCESGAEPVVASDGGIIPPNPDATVIPDGGTDSGDATIDAAADGTTETDGASDAEVDGGADAEAGADPSGRTNLCPTNAGPVDCTTVAGGTQPFCCKNNDAGVYDCRAQNDCPGIRFPCVGRLPCTVANYFCCVTGTQPEGSGCAPTACITNRFYCFSDKDCPAGKLCTGVDNASVTPADASRLWICQ